MGTERVGSGGEPRPGAGKVREMVQTEAQHEGGQGLLQPGRADSISELYRGNPEEREPEVDIHGKGVMGSADREVVVGRIEAKDATRGRRCEGNGGGDGPERGCRDQGLGDQAGLVEGQGARIGQPVSASDDPDRYEDAGRGGASDLVLNKPLRGEDRMGACGFGGRKCCPELARDCFFAEEEFAEARQDRHDICEIDIGKGDCDQFDVDEDGDDYHDAIEGDEEIQVYKCKEYTLEDRVVFAYDSGDFRKSSTKLPRTSIQAPMAESGFCKESNARWPSASTCTGG